MNLSAVLLAGGKSRRMGRDKATLLWKGRPLWQNQLDLLRTLRPNELLISARDEPVWHPADTMFVADQVPSRGPLSGLSATLALTKSNYLLALAIDLPFMRESYLRFLCNQVQPGRGVLPMISERAESLAAIYPVEARSEFEAALRGEDFSLQSVTRELIQAGKLTVVRVSQNDTGLFRNINEPGDVE